MTTPFFLNAWKKIILAYILSCILGFALGSAFIYLGNADPAAVFDISTKRISYAVPVMNRVVQFGVDNGVFLFLWNTIAALVTISFLYTADWFNPHHIKFTPGAVRKFFCTEKKMKLLCFLPGCRKLQEESLRRLYVWLMVPFLGMILLGLESGMSISTSKFIFGSYMSGIISFLPHGLVEIPAFALAGAMAFSAHLLIKKERDYTNSETVFHNVEMHRKKLPFQRIVFLVIAGLFVAGFIEAHVTQAIVSKMYVKALGLLRY
jgi:uncharacterized membrane protein SpoIIM required for sporulation